MVENIGNNANLGTDPPAKRVHKEKYTKHNMSAYTDGDNENRDSDNEDGSMDTDNKSEKDVNLLKLTPKIFFVYLCYYIP
jgi:hypothetical protein